MATAMFKGLSKKVVGFASDPRAEMILFLVAFAESSFFPIPPDVLLIPMVIVNLDKAFRYAFICTAGSVLGGIVGYLIGYMFYDTVGAGIVEFYGMEHKFDQFQAWYDQFSLLIVGVAGFSPIPYKVFTIASGMFSANLPGFIIMSVLSRGARFFLVAWLLWRGGPRFKNWIEKNLYPITMAVGIAAIIFVVLIKFILGGSA